MPTKSQSPKVTTTCIVRHTDKSRGVKQRYDYKCQVEEPALILKRCRTQKGPTLSRWGFLTEDPILSQISSFCVPTIMGYLTTARISLADNLEVIGKHPIEVEYVRYHREHFGVVISPNGLTPSPQTGSAVSSYFFLIFLSNRSDLPMRS